MLLEEKKSIFVAWVTIFWVFRLERLLQKWAYENPLAMSKMRVFVVIFYYWMPSTIRNSLFDKKIKKKKNKKKIAAERFSIESQNRNQSNQNGLSEERKIPSRANENLS